MISVYFIGNSESLSKKLEACYKDINGDQEYDIHCDFQGMRKTCWPHIISTDKKGLLFYELTEDDTKTELETIHKIITQNIHLQWVLLASQEIDYFDIAARFKIGNIIRKSGFDSSVIRAITIRLMTGNVFGFSPYFPNGFTADPIIKTISGKISIKSIMEDFEHKVLSTIEGKARFRLKSYFYELLSNTIAYSVIGISSETRDAGLSSIPSEVVIPEDKPFKIMFSKDKEKYGISVMDTSGTLTLNRILNKLRRQVTIGNEPHPPGVWDLTGRGLSLIQKDNRLIINIVKRSITEIIFLHYKQPVLNKYESIIIAELSLE